MNPAFFVKKQGAVFEREITLGDGTKHALHFRKVPHEAIRRVQNAKEEAEIEQASSALIAAALCNADGTDCITAEEANDLDAGVRIAFAVAIAETNNLSAHVGKVSPPVTPSGFTTS